MKSKNFIETYMSYCSNLEIPEIFNKYMAMSLLSSVTQGKIWLNFSNNKLHPNLYLIFSNNSNCRNTTMKSIGVDLINKVNEKNKLRITILNGNFTLDGLLDTLVKNQQLSDINSALITNCEIFDLSNTDRMDILHFLTVVYRCNSKIEFLTHFNNYCLFKPFINLIVALDKFMLTIPEDVKRSGFLGRCLVIINKHQEQRIANPTLNTSLENDLINHLFNISQLNDQIILNDEADYYYNTWIRNLSYDTPKEFLTSFYRRISDHVLKFAIIFSLSESTDLIIKKSHILEAIDIINETKSFNIPEFIGFN